MRPSPLGPLALLLFATFAASLFAASTATTARPEPASPATTRADRGPGAFAKHPTPAPPTPDAAFLRTLASLPTAVVESARPPRRARRVD